MRRRSFIALSSAAAAAAPTIVRAQTATPVRIGTSPVESYALAYFAREQGFFARNGIDADIMVIPGASGGAAGAVVSGTIDVACVSIGPLANAHLRGIPLRILAPGGIVLASAPTTALCFAKSSPIVSARELNGKTLGTVVLKDLMHVATLKYIDVNGGDSKTVKILELPVADAGPALVSGRIDAYPLPEPLLSAADQNGLRVGGGIYEAIGKRLMISMHVAMNDWLTKNRDAARRVALSLQQAAQWANDNPAGVAVILEKVAKLPQSTSARMKHVVNGDKIEIATIQPQIDALSDYHFIANRFAVADLVWSAR
jgi:NitT/TauT family transport system substrate-binding protein